ncbi:MAG: SAM-dependent methyltransferase [Deltaproteobacteria bacterium RBG_13_52_11]|nr:MAG: SAM-dependent methyltransferase [Deltaproteobacteria bacterium RBG_13_52_11]
MQSTKQNWDAEDYANNSSAQTQWAQELISKLALQGSESLLDIGCGDGKITAQLAQILSAGRILGIDVSPRMIRLATERFPLTKYPNLSFLQMDATRIRLSQQFDVAFSSATLHWVEDHIAVLRGVRVCLKSGGKILLQMGGRGNAHEVFRSVQEVIRRLQWQGYFDDFSQPYHFYGPEEYEAWLSQSGFRTVRVELIPKDMQHQGEEGLRGWLRTTWFPYTDRLPAELRAAFVNEVVDAYTKQHPVDALGNTHVKMVRLEVEAYAL